MGRVQKGRGVAHASGTPPPLVTISERQVDVEERQNLYLYGRNLWLSI